MSDTFHKGLMRPHHSLIDKAFKASDAVLIVLVLFFVFHLSFDFRQKKDLILLLLTPFSFYLAATANDVYRSWRIAPMRHEIRQILISWALTVFVVFVVALLTGVFDSLPRQKIASWAIMTPVALMAWHAGMRMVSRQIRKQGRNIRRVAILGVTEPGLHLADALSKSPWMGLNVAGLYDDRKPEAGRTAVGNEAPYRGNLDDAVSKARSGEIDVVFVALPFSAETRVSEIMRQLTDTTTDVYFAHDYKSLQLMSGRLFTVGDLLVVSVHESPFYGIDGWLKRAEDVSLTVMFLAISCIPILIIAGLIKLTSPGPVIFKQRRYGLNGKPFNILKFRTMRTAKDGDNVVQARPNDSRVTKFGAFLRRSSLDELPQLINVLRDEMSLVGPRPHAVAHNEQYRKSIQSYMLRHKIKPGITGWAQVNGWRGETDTPLKMQKRIEFDLEYIKKWSMWFDIKIIILTLFLIFKDENAY